MINRINLFTFFLLCGFYSLAGLRKTTADSVSINFSVNIEGAGIFVDCKFVGISPLENLKVSAGWHKFSAAKQGYLTTEKEKSVFSSGTIELRLSSQKTYPVLTAVEKKIIPQVVPTELRRLPKMAENPESNYVLMNEKFENESAFQKWPQNTGGTDQKTWTLINGMLRQNSADELLHAITIGDADWKNYIVKARMKIDGTYGDPRAGIIFRETEDGFYLFRIHRESNKAQLAYHCKHPFGWNVVMEKELPVDVTDKWYTAMVYVYDEHIACFLDTIPVFNATAPYSSGGKVGLYSVDSKPLFDDLMVVKVFDNNSQIDEEGARNSSMPVNDKEMGSEQISGEQVSFWFADYFDEDSKGWYHYNAKTKLPFPSFYDPEGCSAKNFSGQTIVSEFSRYNIDNFSMTVSTSLVKTGADAKFEIFFRKTGDSYFSLRFLAKENKVQLVEVSATAEKILKSEVFTEDFFTLYKNIKVVVHKDRVFCQTSSYSKLLDYNGKISGKPGKFGFSATNVRYVMSSLNMASVRELELK